MKATALFLPFEIHILHRIEGMNIKEISIKEIENIKIGQAEDEKAATGCTVIICEKGAPTGLDVRGGGPASRESQLLKAEANAQFIHAADVMAEAIA